VIILPKAQLVNEAIQVNVLAQKNLYEQSKRKLANLMALAQVYSQVDGADLDKFNTVLPTYYPPEVIFGELEEIVNRGGWQMNNVLLESEQDLIESGEAVALPKEDATAIVTGSRSPNIGRINIQFSVSAIDYSGFKKLVRTLENNLRLLDITSVNFSPGEDRANFNVTTYYYKNAE